MADNLKIGANIGIAKQSISFVDAGLTAGNNTNVFKVDGGFQSWVPGRLINPVTGFEIDKGYFLNMKTAVDFTAILTAPGDEITVPPDPAAIDWTLLTAVTETGGGTLHKDPEAGGVVVSANGGGTSLGKLAKVNGNYIQYVLTANLLETTGVMFGLSDNNNGTYQYGVDPLLCGAYVFQPDLVLKRTSGTGGGSDATVATVAGSETVRLAISGNNVLLSINGTLLYTFTGVLTGITNIWAKAFFAGVSTTQRFVLTATALGIA